MLFRTFAAMVYDLPVIGEKIKPHQVTALHLLSALAFTGTGAIIVIYNYSIPGWGLAILIAGLALLGITIFKNKWLTKTKANFFVRIAEFVLALSIAILALVEQWKFPLGIFSVLSAAVLFAIFWERAAGQKLFIHIDDSGIMLPVTARKRFIPWVVVEEVVLRYGTLSVECLQNRLHQWDIAESDIDDEIFMAYCTAQVEANKGKRRNDEW